MDNEQELKWFDKVGKARPTHDAHGTAEDIRANLKQLLPHNWVLRGNQLEGETEHGMLVQTIPTDYILIGTDDHGLPVFRKVVI